MSIYRRIASYLRPYLGIFLVAVLATMVFAVLDTFSLALLIPLLETLFADVDGGGRGVSGLGATPTGALEEGGSEALIGALMDGTVGRFVDLTRPPDEAIQGIIVFLLAVFLFKNIFDYARTYSVAWIEQAVTRDLRRAVYDHMVGLDMAFFGRTRLGQIVSRLTHDVEQLRTLVTKELAKILLSIFELAAALTLMLLISWKLVVASLVILPGMFAIWGPLLKRVKRGDRAILNLAGEVNAHLQETLSGIRLVKASGAEEHERGRFRSLTWDYFKAFIRTERFRALSQPISETVGALGTVIILWYGTRLVLTTGEVSAAEFIGFLGLSLKLYSPVKYLGKLPAIIQPGLVGAERVFEFLDAPVEIRDRPGARTFPGVRETVEFRGVTFSYREGDPVLRDVSFTAPAGTVTALVGPSGAGKTTLVDLLGRFYDVDEGAVLVDGVDLREYAITSIRHRLGIVSQETVLFHDTVRNNLAYGLTGVTDEEVEAAARAAHAHQFIARLPSTYDTLVGERGTQLSGGQRQRLAIARAILRDPPILILDEATSALDSESERLVQAAMDRLLVGRTVFVIAHRLSTIQKAHQILVMEGGRIVQRGSHEQLLAEGGLYGHLHALQFHAEEGRRRERSD